MKSTWFRFKFGQRETASAVESRQLSSNAPGVRSLCRSCRGVAVVESAITLLMFFVLLFGIMEAGRFFQVQQVLTDAAREGARLAVAPYSQSNVFPDNTAVAAEVRRFTNSANVSVPDSGIQIDRNFPCANVAMNCTEVIVTTQYRILTIAMFSDLAVNLRGRAVMRNEAPQ
jgi:Flp pilus assembly protein TadG